MAGTKQDKVVGAYFTSGRRRRWRRCLTDGHRERLHGVFSCYGESAVREVNWILGYPRLAEPVQDRCGSVPRQL